MKSRESDICVVSYDVEQICPGLVWFYTFCEKPSTQQIHWTKESCYGVCSPHNDSVMRKAFVCHDVVMTATGYSKRFIILYFLCHTLSRGLDKFPEDVFPWKRFLHY